MDKLFDSGSALTLFLCFFLPGFVSVKVYDVLVPSERRDFSKALYEVIAYSTLNNVLLFPLIRLIFRNGPGLNPFVVWILAILVFVVFPCGWPFSWIAISKTRFFSKFFVHPTQKPWDYVFGQHQPYWIIVHLKDLRKVGGLFAGRSFASSNPAPPQLYIEELWELDEGGHFIKPVEESEGIIILESEILAVELIGYNQEAEASNGATELDNGTRGLSAEAGQESRIR